MKQILLGLVGMYLSYLIIRFRKHIVDWTGKIGWAETMLGSGGTYNAMVLFAIVIFFFSILYMTGNLDSMFSGFENSFSGGNSK